MFDGSGTVYRYMVCDVSPLRFLSEIIAASRSCVDTCDVDHVDHVDIYMLRT